MTLAHGSPRGNDDEGGEGGAAGGGCDGDGQTISMMENANLKIKLPERFYEILCRMVHRSTTISTLPYGVAFTRLYGQGGLRSQISS